MYYTPTCIYVCTLFWITKHFNVLKKEDVYLQLKYHVAYVIAVTVIFARQNDL